VRGGRNADRTAFDGKKITVEVVYDAKDLIAMNNTIPMTDLSRGCSERTPRMHADLA
jgi:hypothetical protein